jgi:drug/metabolite transporter (DMT)-like permease
VNRALLWCLLANVIGGSTFVALAAAERTGVPIVTFTFWRASLSVVLFVALAAWRRELAPRFSPRDWLLVALVGIPGFALPLVLSVRGVALSTPGLGSILALMEPIAIVPLAFFFLGERPGAIRLLGIAIGLAGALLVIAGDGMPREGLARRDRLLGNVLLAVQGSLWGIYTVAAKPLVGRHSALSVSLWSTILGVAALAVVAPLEWPELRPSALDGVARTLALQDGMPPGVPLRDGLVAALPYLLYLGVFASFLAVLLWNAGLVGVSASTMAVFIFAQPAVGLILNSAVGAEAPRFLSWVGLALILGAVAIVTREPAAPPTPAQPRASS